MRPHVLEHASKGLDRRPSPVLAVEAGGQREVNHERGQSGTGRCVGLQKLGLAVSNSRS